MPHGANLRKGRFSEPGRIYLITTVTEDRQPLFYDIYAGRLVVDQMRLLEAQGFGHTWAYVIMPDHLHWLVELKTGSLSRLVLRVKSKSAIALNAYLGRENSRVWQKGFHDHAVRREEDLRALARYIIANPVRAGLADSVRDYPLWDAAWL